MSSSFVLTLIILAVLLASLFFLLQSEGGIGQWPHLAARVGLSPQRWQQLFQLFQPPTTPVPTLSPLLSGGSRFSQSTCLLDTECFVSGCSNEVCGNKKVASSCEYSPDFPSLATHACGCVSGRCGWTKK